MLKWAFRDHWGQIKFELLNFRLNINQLFSTNFQALWKVGCLPQKDKVDLLMTNTSKFLIFYFFIFIHFCITYKSKVKTYIKSKKSDLWNLFKVSSQHFRVGWNFLNKFDQNSTSKNPTENFWTMSLDNPNIDAKNSVGFLEF